MKYYLIKTDKDLKKDYFDKQVEINESDIIQIFMCLKWCELDKNFCEPQMLKPVMEKIVKVYK